MPARRQLLLHNVANHVAGAAAHPHQQHQSHNDGAEDEDPSWAIFRGRAEGGNADDLAFTFGVDSRRSAALPASAPPPLLTDAEVQTFIQHGHIVINADFRDGGETHREIVRRLDDTWSEGTAGSNDPLSAVNERPLPELQQVLGHPAVVGALTSLLGPGYIINQHHHIHLRLPGQAQQMWHKDAYPFDHAIRSPRLQWLFVLYYPHDVVEDMGPTAILPGRAALEGISSSHPDQATEQQELLCVPGGSVALIDFDAWHRATATTGQTRRYMLKFQAARTAPPDVPSWDNSSIDWEPPAPLALGADLRGAETDAPFSPFRVPECLYRACLGKIVVFDRKFETNGAFPPDIQRDLWQWLCGQRHLPPSASASGNRPDETQQQEQQQPPCRTVITSDGGQLPYVKKLSGGQDDEEEEAKEIHATFRIAEDRSDPTHAAEQLLEQLARAAAAAVGTIYEKLASNGHGNNPQPPAAALALAAMGDSAVEPLLLFLARAVQGECEEQEDDEDEDEERGAWLALVHTLTVLGLIAPRDPTLKFRSVAAVVRCLEPLPHHHWWVRRAAVEALGRLLSAASSAPLLDPFTPEPKPESDDHASGPAAGVVAAAQRQLLEALRDADRRVRRASAISITQLAIAIIGRGSIPSADSDELCIPGGTARVLLEGMVEDDIDSYNRWYAALALEALDAAGAAAEVVSWEISLAAALRVQQVQGQQAAAAQ